MSELKVMTMRLMGTDGWDRPVYKCIETGDLYKDITLGSSNPQLYDCDNNVDGEPGFPIESGVRISFYVPEPEKKEKPLGVEEAIRILKKLSKVICPPEVTKIAINAMEKQIPKKPIMIPWTPAKCPACGAELSESVGDGYYKHYTSKKVCDCGQKLKWYDKSYDEEDSNE